MGQQGENKGQMENTLLKFSNILYKVTSLQVALVTQVH